MGDYENDNHYREREDYLVRDVENFIKNLNRKLRSRDLYEIQSLYENDVQSLAERYYKASSWPSSGTVGPLVDEDKNFLCLYNEIYYRHIYAKLGPSVDDRFDSFQNYIDLFNIILGLTSHAPELVIPSVWLWDIIDEFIYQFRTFHHMRQSASLVGDRTSEELQLLKDHPHVWSAQTVIRYLHALVRKANTATTNGDPVDPFFKNVAEFSIIGLSHVMTLLCDYYGALRVMDPIDLSTHKRSYATSVIACHTTLRYNLAFSYLMLRRYSDAIDCLSEFLIYISRNKQTIPRSWQEESINKKITQMTGLLAIAVCLAPQTLEDSVAATMRDTMREKYADKLGRMQRGDLLAFEEIFEDVCPKFVTPAVPDYEGGSNFAETVKLQLKMFSMEVRQRTSLPDLYSYLRLCNSTSIKKLALLSKKDEDSLLTELIAAKIKNKSMKRVGSPCAPLGGDWTYSAPVSFFLRNDLIHVAQSRDPDRHGEWFMGQIIKYEDMLDDISRQVGN